MRPRNRLGLGSCAAMCPPQVQAFGQHDDATAAVCRGSSHLHRPSQIGLGPASLDKHLPHSEQKSHGTPRRESGEQDGNRPDRQSAAFQICKPLASTTIPSENPPCTTKRYLPVTGDL